ncbi:hypothetical protein C8R44DRAFT_747948 [Mycena epipterygia]|nr:hypothetical protein C8R44DRAFT_747948 [Mycena epipterygia]
MDMLCAVLFASGLGSGQMRSMPREAKSNAPGNKHKGNQWRLASIPLDSNRSKWIQNPPESGEIQRRKETQKKMRQPGNPEPNPNTGGNPRRRISRIGPDQI